MSWDSDFYSACMSNAEFQGSITKLFKEFREDAVAPFARYQLISANGTNELLGSTREGERRIQLTVAATTPSEAEDLAIKAMIGAQGGLNVISVFERSLGRDPDEKLFGYAIDLIVWFDNP